MEWADDGDAVQQVTDEGGIMVQSYFLEFLSNFSSEKDPQDEKEEKTGEDVFKDYVQQAASMREAERGTMYVDFAHVMQFNYELASAIEVEFLRFEPYLKKALKQLMNQEQPGYVDGEVHEHSRLLFVGFYNLPLVQRVRELKTDRIGRLVSMSGTVTRSTDVKPELLLGTFTCRSCSTVFEDVEQQFQYTEPRKCKHPSCENTRNWEIDMQQSRFVDWQKLRVQENAEEIPAGSMPRSLEVVLRHEVVEKAKAGDKIVFTGTLIVIPDSTGFARAGENPVASKSRGGAHNIRDNVEEGDDHDIAGDFTEEERQDIIRMSQEPNLYYKMCESMAPKVFSHMEVKRGILLMLFGGVHKTTPEGIKLRGDINVCIVGDPSTAKSQFLKYVCSFLPRAIFTSGKASSAAGLTASVVRDHETGEFCVEAGALMLADNGICCIDEFDKMDIGDQVAIHEAMEQQTISITKAGIQATLNARTSILAAANPLYGRYDRFDLFFVVLDECDEVADYQIANHIIRVHQDQAEVVDPPFTTGQLQRYIRFARRLTPVITEAGKRAMVECYRSLRQNDCLGQNKAAYRITVRQLESMIRLSEALARLHLDDEVRPKYIKEAYRLLRKSIIHVESEDITLEEEHPGAEEEDGMAIDGENGVAEDEERKTAEAADVEEAKEADAAAVGGEEGKEQGDREGSEPPAPKSKKRKRKKIQVKFEEYQRISSSICTYLRQKESQAGASEAAGVAWGDAVAWYCEEHEGELSTAEDLSNMQTLVAKVINRLVNKESVLIYCTPGEADKPQDERIITVHPNVVT